MRIPSGRLRVCRPRRAICFLLIVSGMRRISRRALKARPGRSDRSKMPRQAFPMGGRDNQRDARLCDQVDSLCTMGWSDGNIR